MPRVEQRGGRSSGARRMYYRWTSPALSLLSPQILRLDDDQRHMRGAARPIDMTHSGPVTCQADIACMEDLDGAATAAALELARQEDRQVVDDLRMPVDESILPAHEAEAGRGAGRAPLIRWSREQLRKFGKICAVILALIQVLDVGLVSAPRCQGARNLEFGIGAGPIRRNA